MLGRFVVAVVAALAAGGCVGRATCDMPRRPVVRTAVIGGMVMSGQWQQISRMFEAETGYKVQVVVTGQRPKLAEAFRQGKADLLTMHSGDITSDLVAHGYGVHMRAWTHNGLVIVGPISDPAGIRGMSDGGAAFRQIATKEANIVDFRGIGSREVCHKLWRKAGVVPQGDWVLKDESGDHSKILQFAADHNAYVVVGRMPVLFGKLKAPGMEILVDADPDMRRPYNMMAANPEFSPGANHAGARALSDFLLSEKVQTFLAQFGAEEHGGIPLFHPARPVRQAE